MTPVAVAAATTFATVAIVLASRRRTFAAVLALLGSAVVLVLAYSPLVAARINVVVITDAPEVPATIARELRTSAVLREDVASCAAYQIESGSSRSGAGAEPSRRSACSAVRVGDVANAHGPMDAMRRAIGSLARPGALASFLEWARGDRRRIVLVVDRPEQWSRWGAELRSADLIAELERERVSVDVVGDPLGALARSPPSLRLVATSTFLGAWDQFRQYRFRLELHGFDTEGVDDASFSCGLDSDCVSDQDCGDGLTCEQGLCSARCAAGDACSSGESCEGLVCQRDASWPSWRRIDAPVELHPLASDVGSVVLASREIDLGELEGSSVGPAPGWHSLRCWVSYRRAASSRYETLREDLFLQARTGAAYMVWGRGDTLALAARPPDDEAAQILQRVLLADLTPELETVGGLAPDYEPARAVAPLLDRVSPSSPRITPPDFLIVHDASRAYWESHCTSWMERVRDEGATLLAVGAPPPGACTAFPIESTTWSPDDARTVLYDRRPRVIVVGDPSRIGRMRWAPTTSPPDPAGSASLRARSELVSLRDGLALQREAVSALAAARSWLFDASGPALRARVDRPFTHPAVHLEVAGGSVPYDTHLAAVGTEGSYRAMTSVSDIDERLAEVVDDLRRPEPHSDDTVRVGVNDVVIVFAYDVRRPDANGTALARLLSGGATVIVVGIATPYGAGSGRESLHEYLARQLRESGDGPIRVRRERVLIASPAALAPAGTGPLPTAFGVASTGGSGTAVAAVIARRLDDAGRPDGMDVGVRYLGRYLDERVIPAGAIESVAEPVGSGHGAPLVYQALRAQRGEATTLAVMSDFALEERDRQPTSVAVGAVVGRGHILALGYSPVEGALGGGAFDGVRWSADPSTRVYVARARSPWGPRLVGALSELTRGLEPLPTRNPRIVGMRGIEGRFVDIELQQRSDERASAERVFLVPVVEGSAAADCVENEDTARLALVDFAPETHRYTYRLGAEERERLCGGRACLARVCRTICSGANCQPHSRRDEVYLPATAPAPTADRFRELEALQQVLALARFSGGSAARDIAPAYASLRPRLIPAFVTVLCAFWVLLATRRQRRSEPRPRPRDDGSRVDAVAGLVRQAAEALGEPVSGLPAGAFARYRPLQPGDSLRSALRSDVLRLAGALQPEGALPRVLDRIDERAGRVRLVVNCSHSASARASQSTPSARDAGARVTAVVAQLAIARKCTVILHVVGAAPQDRILDLGASESAPTAAHDAIVEQNRPSAAARLRVPRSDWVELVEPGEVVVYVSDMLQEDHSELGRASEQIALDGGAAGFVRLRGGAGHHLAEIALESGGRYVLDRTGWTARDVATADSALALMVESKLAESLGGVLHVDVDLDDATLIATILGSRLMEVVR